MAMFIPVTIISAVTISSAGVTLCAPGSPNVLGITTRTAPSASLSSAGAQPPPQKRARTPFSSYCAPETTDCRLRTCTGGRHSMECRPHTVRVSG
eukprot:3426255-Rhodomonas_salina.1